MPRSQKTLKSFFSSPSAVPSPPAVPQNEACSSTSISGTEACSSTALEETEAFSSSVTTGKRKFPKQWETEYPWIQHDKQQNKMFCKICIKHKKSNAFSSGTDNYRKDTVKKHVQSSSHKEALDANSQRSMQDISLKIVTKRETALIAVLKNAYWIAKEELPSSLLPSLNLLCSSQGVEKLNELNVSERANYSSHQSISEYQKVLSATIEEEVLLKVKSSRFFGLMVDESTDIATQKTLITSCKIISTDGTVSVHYLGDIPMGSHGDAATLYNTLCEFLQLKNIDIQNMRGLATDGAPVMCAENGLAGKFASANQKLVTIHCVAHRLNLVVNDSVKNEKIFKEVKSTLTTLYSYFQRSATRFSHLKEMAKVLELPVVKFQPIYEVRWFSLPQALNAVIKSYETLIITLEDIAENESDCVAEGLSKKLKTGNIIGFIIFLNDVLSTLNVLWSTFMRDNVNISSVLANVTAAIEAVKDIHMTPSSQFIEFQGEMLQSGHFKGSKIKPCTSNFDDICQKLLESVESNLNDRFPSGCHSILKAFSIFNPTEMPKTNLSSYGNEDIQTLYSFYKDDLSSLEELEAEWRIFKKLMAGNYRHLSCDMILKVVNKDLADMYPNICTLLMIREVIPVNSVSCERLFSLKNRIKTKLRNRLLNETVDCLIRICAEGPDLSVFPFEKAALKWKNEKSRRLFEDNLK